MSKLNYFYERKCYMCERRTVPEYRPPSPPPPPRIPRVRFAEPPFRKMLSSASQYQSVRSASSLPRVIKLTSDQEEVLQRHFRMWPRAPHPADVVLLAAETGLSEEDVEGWYAIRLAQWRKEQGLGGNLGLH